VARHMPSGDAMSHVPVKSKPYPTRPEAQWAMDAYYRDYHPYGYGTALKLVKDADGWRFVGGRWDSCD
jgi:hypothetical protein